MRSWRPENTVTDSCPSSCGCPPPSLPLHTLADIRRPRALPYDGICQGLSRNPVPGKGRLPLIADANAYDPRSVNIFRQPGYHIDYILIDLDRVMGHPAVFINDLLMGLIRPL